MKTLETTIEILNTHAPWIIRHLPLYPTAKQEPRDLIAIALRNAGFDFFASAAKATEIIRASNLNPVDANTATN